MTYLYPYRRGTGWRSQGFRSRPNQGPNGPGGHTGFDQAMEAGRPLYAPADGIIRNSGWLSDNYRDNGWWLTRMGGDTLVIDCTDALGRSDTLPTFIFAHCSDTMAEVGQRVRKGQLVALSGNTGTATTGLHVHIEALPPQWDFNNGVYGRVDPERYFDEWIDDYASGSLAAMGTITPLSEEDDMPSIEEITAVIDSRVDELTKRTNDQHAETRKQNEAQHIKTRDVVRNDTQAQQDITRGYLADRVKAASPADLVAAIPDNIAQQVIDGLAARLGAK